MADESEYVLDELTEEQWRSWIVHTLEDELHDTRQDIYEMDE